MRVTAYTRASTDRQEMSVPDQLKLIRAYCEAKGYLLVHPERYSDEGLSGTTFLKRPGIMALIADVESKRHDFERVIIHDESRFGRPEDSDDSTFYELILKRAGVLIEYIKSQNVEGIVGRIERTIKYSQASDYSKQLGESVIRGSVGFAEKGFSVGGLPPFGYARMLYSADGKPLQVLPPGEQKATKKQRVRWVPGDPADVALVRRIFELALTHSIKGICQILNKEGARSPEGGAWEVTTLYYLLKNRAYIGERSYGGSKFSKRLKKAVVCPLAHEPILDRKLFEEAQESMEKRSFTKKATYQKSTYLLTSKLRCVDCGYNFFGKRMKSRGYLHEYYQCNGYEAHRVCTSFLIKRDPLEAFVLQSIKELIASGEYKKSLMKYLAEMKREDVQSRSMVKTLRSELKVLDREIERIQDELLETPSKSLRVRLLDREARKETLEQQIEAASKAPRFEAAESVIQEYVEMIEEYGKDIESATIEERKRLVSYFLEKGEVDRERREVRLFFFRLPAASMLIWPLDSNPAEGGGGGGLVSCGSVGRRRADLLPSRMISYRL